MTFPMEFDGKRSQNDQEPRDEFRMRERELRTPEEYEKEKEERLKQLNIFPSVADISIDLGQVPVGIPAEVSDNLWGHKTDSDKA